MSWLLLGILLVLLAYLVFLTFDLWDYRRQLRFIGEEESNQELRLNTRFPLLKEITLTNNQIIRKQKESRRQLLQETQHLEQAIHNISHDLRTPLSVANGYTQMLLRNTQDLNQADTLKKIKNNLDAVDAHLESLLNYQRLNENQISYQLEKVDVSRMVEEQLVNLYETFQTKGFSLTPKIEKNLLLVTDKSAFSRIIQNILGNMLEHGEQAGVVELKKIDTGLVFRVSNQVAEAINHPERLTERFYTEDLSRNKQNAGIGLFIVDKMVTDLGGELAIETKKNQFEVTVTFNQ